MIYNNILYLLIVILILTSKHIPDTPQIPFYLALPLFLAKACSHFAFARSTFRGKKITSSPVYFKAEQKFSVIAVISLAVDVYFLDILYYPAQLPPAAILPLLVHLAGLMLFFIYLAFFWSAAHGSYVVIFGGVMTRRSFIVSNLKNVLVIVLPWLLLSFFADLLQHLKLPLVTDFLASAWGETAVFILFFVSLLLVFPVLVTRLWNCTPLPPGPLRLHIEQFCRSLHLGYRDIMLWPLFEGKLLTAGVMGFIKKFRYLLITPAMLETMTLPEIEAVMAHEIGHVKRYHIQLYLLLFLGFAVVVQFSALPFFQVVLTSDLFYRIAFWGNQDPGSKLAFLTTTFMLILLVVYFRYIFGFFMRNFERQADLYALEKTGHSGPIVSVFEKIALLSGNIRDLPSWHHFSLAQRIRFLRRCELQPQLILRHHRKVYFYIALYATCILLASVALWKAPTFMPNDMASQKFATAFIKKKMATDPQNFQWHHYWGDLQQNQKKYAAAIAAYEKALLLNPQSADTMNNLAWLLLTSEDHSLHDPEKALALAEQAVTIKPAGHIYDTLAEAYFVTGDIKKAMDAEQKAIAVDPAGGSYYKKQLEKFQQAEKARP